MLNLLPMPTLAELLDEWERLPKDEQLATGPVIQGLVRMQQYPDITLVALSGIHLPTHQRLMLYQAHRGVGSNVNVSSRGTSKSATWCVLYASYKNLCFSRRDAVTLSATGFRGGQIIFVDAERWIKGGWDDQLDTPRFLRDSIPRPQLVTRAQNYWELAWDSYSKNTTLPTKNPDDIRGVRAKDLYIDEANFVDPELIDKVATPFLNVTSGFRTGGALAAGNSLYFSSTIDFTWRPFQDRIKAARDGITRDYLAARAIKQGDLARYEELELQGLHEYTLTSFDYTDLLIRKTTTTRDGRTFEVTWPDPNIPLTHAARGIPLTQRDADGRMRVVGDPVSFYQTYPIDRAGLERSLLDGSADGGSWMAEQRNVTDTAHGDVYLNEVVDRSSCEGDHAIIRHADLGENWAKFWGHEQPDYVSPVLWRCTDPCVLGVDYAPTSDFCAFVVIRLGPLAKDLFNPFTHHGKTTWSNVVWCEQHQKMSAPDAAEKIWQLLERYNLVWFQDPGIEDPWEACRAIGLDMRGGGSAIRDELAYFDQIELPSGRFRIYDSFDKDERIAAFRSDASARPMLDSIWPTDMLNDKLVEFTATQMRAGQLYLPKYLDVTARPAGQKELHVGYDAARTLDRQLRKLRQAPTKNYRTFYMEGDTQKVINKKDLWAAYIYAAKQARAHLIRQAQIDSTPPPLGALVSRIGSKRGQYGRNGGRAPGAKD